MLKAAISSLTKHVKQEITAFFSDNKKPIAPKHYRFCFPSRMVKIT